MADAITSDDRSSTIFTMTAMNKDGLMSRRVDDVEHALNFRISRTREFRQRNVVIKQAQRLGFSTFRAGVFVFAAQIHDCLDAERFQSLQAVGFWLCAAIQLRIHLVEVWQLSIARFTLRESIDGQRPNQDADHQWAFSFPSSHEMLVTTFDLSQLARWWAAVRAIRCVQSRHCETWSQVPRKCRHRRPGSPQASSD